MSRIEQIISEMEEYLDGCKAQAFSNSKRIVVEKDVMDDMLVELRMRTPDEIKKYQKIIANKEEILADAKMQADAATAEANKQKATLVSQHEIMQQAYEEAESVLAQTTEQAQKIINDAVIEADGIREGAVQYTDQLLRNLQTVLAHSMESAQGRFNSFYNQLQASYEVISSNRKELYPQNPMDDSEIKVAIGEDL